MIESPHDKKFTHSIYFFRTIAGLTQSQLADLVGCSKNAISSFERYEYNPSAETALRICIALNRRFEDVFYFMD